MVASQALTPLAQAGMDRVALSLNPAYTGFVSKTGEREEGLHIRRSWVGSALLRYARTRPQGRGSPLWSFGLLEFRQRLQEAAAAVGLGELGVVPYTARHTGASLDRLEDNLSLAEVQRRGRWKAEASVRRYEKRTMAQEVAHMLSAHTRAYYMRVSGQLPAWLE